MRRVLLVIAVVAFLTAPAYAAREITQADLDTAEQARIDSQNRLQEATAQYEASIRRLEQLQGEVARLSVSLTNTEAELAVTKESAAQLLGQMYRRNDFTGIGVYFETVDIGEAAIKLEYLSRMTDRENAEIVRVEALSASYAAQSQRMNEALARQRTTNDQLAALGDEIVLELERANTAYQEITAAYKEQEYRKWLATSTTTTTTTTTTTRAPTTTTTGPTATTTTTTQPPEQPPATGDLVCPVNGPVSFVDSWGAPRSGGRTHKGVDMIAAKRTPLVAIEDAVVKRMGNGSLGGITVWLTGVSGDEYYYAHMDGWAEGLTKGQSVSAGQLIGYVGNTGNARYTVNHVHFQFHPGGGSAVNPYPLVKCLCG
jgi:peptidoglycan LD-endopeptidase LytH